MKILHLSDTHGKHRELPPLPEADVIVHSGDFTLAGSENEAYDFMDWFCALPYRHKLFIAGNHDFCMYGAHMIGGLPPDVHYLCSSGVVIGGLLFYGVPMFMQECVDGQYDKRLAGIPNEVDVLITHNPPFGVLDFSGHGARTVHCGDTILMQKILDIKPHCHLFGHNHSVCGVEVCSDITFSNAAVLDNDYELVRAPNVIVV